MIFAVTGITGKELHESMFHQVESITSGQQFVESSGNQYGFIYEGEDTPKQDELLTGFVKIYNSDCGWFDPPNNPDWYTMFNCPQLDNGS